MDNAFELILFALIAFVVVYGYLAGRKADKQRIQGLEQAAAERGLTLTRKDDGHLLEAYRKYKFIDSQNKILGKTSFQNYPRIENFCEVKDGDEKYCLFEFIYGRSSGNSVHDVVNAVVELEVKNRSVPDFYLYPEHRFHKLNELFGAVDVDIPHYPEFSRKYVVNADDKNTVMSFFQGGPAAFFEQHDGLMIEVKDGRCLYAVEDKLAAEDFYSLVDRAKTLLGKAGARIL